MSAIYMGYIFESFCFHNIGTMNDIVYNNTSWQNTEHAYSFTYDYMWPLGFIDFLTICQTDVVSLNLKTDMCQAGPVYFGVNIIYWTWGVKKQSYF